MASGKSTLASRLALELSVPVVEADRTRKFLAGVPASTPLLEKPWEGTYSEAFGERVYEELGRRARAVLSTGRPVIVDASFRSRSQRKAMRSLARTLGVPFTFVECRPDIEVCRERLRHRESEVSDGRLEIFDDFARRWEATSELDPREHIVIDTARPIEDTMALLRARLPVSFDGLTG